MSKGAGVDKSQNEFRDLAAWDALGLLSEEEARELAEAFSGADSSALEAELIAYRETAAALACELTPAPPSSGVFDRIVKRIEREDAVRPVVEVLAGQGEWKDIGFPGIAVKMLFRDKEARTNTMLLRMEPGARLPSHHHHDTEQCWILEGDVRWEGLVYKAGDFVVAGKGSLHPALTSERGALLLLVAGRSEFTHA